MNRSGQGSRFVNAAVAKGQLHATMSALPRSPPPTPKKERPPREAGDADILEPAKAIKIVTPQSPVREPMMISRPTASAAYNPNVVVQPMVTPTRSIAPITPYSIPRTNTTHSPGGAGSGGAPFQPMSAAKRPREDETIPFRGMKNLGNTCYVNAIVAAMRSVPALVDAVNRCDASSGVVHALQEVFGCTAAGYGSAVEPVALLDVLKEGDPLFLRTVQQDAHEALTSVLRMLLEQRCRVDDVLQGDMTNTVTCNDSVCGTSTSVAENFLVMSLAVPDTETSMLHVMNGHEKVIESVEHTCNTCGNLRATSVRELTRYPPCLILHLKRFRFTPGEQHKRKIHTSVTVMTNLVLMGRTYHLKALVSHIGDHASSGHYICDFIKDNKLYTQDDSTVSGGVAPWTVMPSRMRNAYLAFYVEGSSDPL